MEINSKEYWDQRFQSGDWDENQGESQTIFFTELAYQLLPEPLKRELGQSRWRILDIGCAEGGGTALLADQFPNCNVTGFDFSPAAIELAQKRHPQCSFVVGDLYQEIPKADVIFSSNTLEHLHNPQTIMEKMCCAASKYVILLLPFEDELQIAEHINFFSLSSFSIHINNCCLEYFLIDDCTAQEGTLWPGSQCLLVFTNEEYRKVDMTVQSIYNNYGITDEISSYKEKVQNTENEIIFLQDNLNNIFLENRSKDEIINNKNYELKRISLELETASNDLSLKSKELDSKSTEIDSLIKAIEHIKFEKEILQTTSLEKIKECEEELEKTKKELDFRNYVYDDLYAYSASLNSELKRIKESRSYKFFAKYMKGPMHIGYKIASKIGRIIKYTITFNYHDLSNEITMPVKKIATKICGKLQYKKLLDNLQKDIKGRRIIVMPPTLDWHMRLFQRPQQLALAYSKKENTTVIYLTANLQHDNVAVAENISEHLWLVYSGYVKELQRLFASANQVIMSLSWTINAPYIELLNPDKLIYEYIDELEIFDKYDEKMLIEHQQLMLKADITVCTATKLYEKARSKAKNPILSPNAGDYSFFEQTSSYEINKIIRDKVEKYKCVLGYYGALASWFDYDLVIQVAQKHPDWLFVLIGMNYDGTLDKSGIGKYKNILYISPQPYQELPSFLTAFDIATIPFVINEITLSTSPVKLFEYMAGGKPILTSKMPECLKYESVHTYEDADDFCRLAEEYMNMKSEDPYWDTLKREALENTWDARTDQILEAIEVNGSKEDNHIGAPKGPLFSLIK